MQEKELARLRALYSYDIIDSDKERDFDRLTEIASLIADCEISLISFIDKNRVWYKSAKGLSVEEEPRGFTMCECALLSDKPFIVEDTLEDAHWCTHPMVQEGIKVRFYAGFPLIDPNGFTLGSFCVISTKPNKISLSQQKQLSLLAEEAITVIVDRRKKQEYKNFSHLINNSEDLICILAQDWTFKMANPCFNECLGWSEEELQFKTIFDIVPEEDQDKAKAFWSNIKKGQADEQNTHQIAIKTGGHRIIEWSATAEKTDKNIFAIGRDVTAEIEKNQALKVSEQKLKAFFESSQGLMCTHDIHGKLISINPIGARTLGYSRAELIDKTLFDIVPIEQHDDLHQYLADILSNGFSKGYMVIKRKSGEERLWLYSNILEGDLNGEPYIIGNAVDITDQKKLEKDLLHTKNLLEETSALSKIGGWELNLVDHQLYWSSITREIHSVPDGFIPTKENAIQFYKSGESREKIMQTVQECLLTGKDWDLELQIIDFNGKEIWVRTKGNVHIVKEEPIRLYGTFQNIDDQKRAQLEVTASKKLLDDVLSAATGVSIIATDLEGTITVFNEGSVQLLGYTAEEIIGKQTPVIFHDPKEIEELCTDFSSSLDFEVSGFGFYKQCADHLQKERTFTFITKSGKRLRVSLSITSIKDSNGNIIGYLGISIDITQKEATEKELATEKALLLAFIENAPASVAMIDADMRFLMTSKTWLKDYTQIEGNIKGLSYYDVFPNLSDERKAVHQEVLNGRVVKKEEDVYVDVKTNTPNHISWEMRPWFKADNSIGGMMIFTHNISASVHHRQELTVARLRADLANMAKSEFLANMSHEIRTPLNGVIGFTDLVLKTQLNHTQKQYLKIVNQSANALLSIINDILDFSKIEAGKFELDIERCDLYEIAGQASDITNYQIQTKKLEMLLNVQPNLPRFIWTDALRLKQVLINLLGNAAKFTAKGEIELKIESLSESQNHHLLRFSVRDTGIGIAKGTQAKIFNAFSQEDSSTTKKYGGTGLGLTISNKLLKMMDSRLYLESSPGQGSIFYFDLNLKSEEGDPVEWLGLENVTNVLIVDDNDNNRNILTDMLLLKNIKSDHARNGFEALQFLAEGRNYDAILMDYHMQYMDGIETTKKIRDNFTHGDEKLPVILLHSSSDDGTIIKACNELEIENRLLKPIKIDKLYHALVRLKTKEPVPRNLEISAPIVSHKNHEYSFLIVEDNEVNRFLTRSYIEKLYPQSIIVEAENGLVGIKEFEKMPFSLVFMDIQMPEMNGYACTKKIRSLEKGKRTPIIALTAANVKGEREKSVAADMDDFMTKPVLEENIEAILSKWLVQPETPERDATENETDQDLVHFNIKKLASYFSEDAVKLQKIIGITLNQLHQAQQQLDKNILPEDAEMVLSISHKLYGMSTSAGLENLAGISRELQKVDVADHISLQKGAAALLAEIKLLIPVLMKHKKEE
ncbi:MULTISPECIES: PAS domain S-box protein [unclassified Pedobacter]|uniref:PAS domain S-box protein n=1 Tax=unclassified Pedobacter TaxID=2628915 RepID=UPI002246E671|nr:MULTISPECIES: PAS domain S-box protein [unclassified Pedobacter]MCX2429268.1 PAS domain S-box protein [Pedobacter sp. GR22-10]MCX2583703.1 PAS domain S-box protein [Pedobacter sp. MR22-3]